MYFFFQFFLYENKNKQHRKKKKKKQQQKHVKQNNKTRLTQKKNKTLKLCKTKTRKERRSDRITWSPFPSTPWKNLSFEQTLEPVARGKN